jgi:hypothetical protein
MTETLVLFAAAAILPLLLLLFAFVGCEAREAGETPEAGFMIGPGSFGNIERVDATFVFDDGQQKVTKQLSFGSLTTPITQGMNTRTVAWGMDAKANGEVKSVKIICSCELVPKLPTLDTLVRTAVGDSIEMSRFELSGEEFAFTLQAIAEL